MLKTTEQIALTNGKCLGIEEIECFCPGDPLPFPPKLDRVSQIISSSMCCVLGGAGLFLLGSEEKLQEQRKHLESRQGASVPQWDQTLQLGSSAALGSILVLLSPV